VVFDGKVVTAAGVSSGLDMALALVARVAGDETAQAIQLAIEYDPQPPFDAGAPQKASAAVRDAATKLLQSATTLEVPAT
jgi:transcriptional regulator GlxA family with amidase domain